MSTETGKQSSLKTFDELRASIGQRSLGNAARIPVATVKSPDTSSVISPLRIGSSYDGPYTAEQIATDAALDAAFPTPIPEVSHEALASDEVVAEPVHIETKTADPVADRERSTISAEVALEDNPADKEAEEAAFEKLIDDAFSGTSPEASERVAIELNARLGSYNYFLNKLDTVAMGDERRERERDILRARAELQRSLNDSATGFLRMLAQGSVTPSPEVLASQRKIVLDLKGYLEKDNKRVVDRLFDWEAPEEIGVDSISVEPVHGGLIGKKEEKTVAEVPEIEELPKGPEDVAYGSLKEDWSTLRAVYEAKEKTYQDALRAELAAQAKSWNPLKSIPYAARKMFGFNQKLTTGLEEMKAEASAGAMLYRDASQALAIAKRDALVMKFDGLDMADEKVNAILARHERMLGRKLVLSRAQEQLDVMQQAPSVAEHPCMQKALEIIQKGKWARMGGMVGIAALGGLTGGIGAALVAGGISIGGIATGMGAAAGVKAGLSEKIKALLEKSARTARADVGLKHLGVVSYDDVLSTTERALEKEAMAKKHASYTNLAAASAAVVAGGAYGGMTSAEVLAPVAPEVPVEEEVSAEAAPEVPVAPEVSESPVVPEVEATEVPAPQPVSKYIVSPMAQQVVPDTQFTQAPQIEAVPAPVEPEVPPVVSELPRTEVSGTAAQSEYTQPVEKEYGGELYQKIEDTQPITLEAAPLTPEVAETVRGIETFNVEKPGFLGMFTTNELQTTGGEVYATMKGYTLEDIAKIYQDPAFRTQVFPNGVSQESLERWVTWIQEHNTQTTPAYTNLKLEDFVTTVHRAH